MAKIIKIPSVEVIDTKVAGVSKANEDGSSRQQIIMEYVNEGDLVSLRTESDNEYDPDAVAVYTMDGKQIGYVRREVAPQVKSAIVNQAQVIARVSWVGGREIKGVGLRLELVN